MIVTPVHDVSWCHTLAYASAILAAAKAFKGPQALGAPALECGYDPTEPGVCNNRSQFFLYQGKNVWKKEAGWLQPPAAETS